MFNPKLYNKLITHTDFDGIVSAVLLSTLNSKLTIVFANPSEMRELNDVDDKTMISDLPYVKGCGAWFDHHASNTGKGYHQIAASAARVIYNNLHLAFPKLIRYEDLVEWCDKIDTANYSKQDILRPEGYVLLAFTLSLDDDDDYLLYVIDLIKKQSIDSILLDSKVKNKVKRVRDNLKRYLKIVNSKIKVYDNLFYILDLRGIDVDHGIKFIAHTLFDDQKIGVFILDGDDDIAKFSVSYNYLYRSSYEPVDLSKVSKYYKGGGHPRASGFSIKNNEVTGVLKELIKLLNLLDWQPKFKKK